MYHVLRFGREIANLALKSANVRTANPPTFGVKNLRKVQKFYSVSSQPFCGKDFLLYFAFSKLFCTTCLQFYLSNYAARVYVCLCTLLHVPHASKQ